MTLPRNKRNTYRLNHAGTHCLYSSSYYYFSLLMEYMAEKPCDFIEKISRAFVKLPVGKVSRIQAMV